MVGRGVQGGGLIEVEELLSGGVCPQGGVNAQLAQTGVKVCHWSYDTTEHSQGVRHHQGLSVQCHLHSVMMFASWAEARGRWQSGHFIEAVTVLILTDTEKKICTHPTSAFSLCLFICLSEAPLLTLLQASSFLGSTAAHRLWWEVWAKMSQGLRGFASCIPLDQLPSVLELLPPPNRCRVAFLSAPLCPIEIPPGKNILPCLQTSKEGTDDGEQSSKEVRRKENNLIEDRQFVCTSYCRILLYLYYGITFP